MNEHSLARLLTWLAGLGSGVALTPENLSRDFTLEQPHARESLRALTAALETRLAQPDGMLSKLFEQWKLFFSESVDYYEAFGGRKLEPLEDWVGRAGITVRDAPEAERFFFALHTYFALLVKLLAWLALSRHLAVRLGAPSFGQLLTADSGTLRRSLQDMESGGIFRRYGLANLLEGDFFAWYLYAWSPELEGALRGILERLDRYDPTTITVVPEETRDLFKKLYHYLLPREIRHNLGEYYTPDWLAQRLLNQLSYQYFGSDLHSPSPGLRRRLLQTRFLDPACGFGTFPVLIIGRMRAVGTALMVDESDLLHAILRNVVGFDLNPLAVLTARVNYLLALADLLEYRREEITIPVYLADSVLTPAIGDTLETAGAYQFPTAVGKFLVPTPLCTQERFDPLTQMLEEGVGRGLSASEFVTQVETRLQLASPEWDAQAVERLAELYDRMADLHRQGMDGLWGRLLRNNFAPLTVGRFDYVVGNPPWVNWEHLPDAYRDGTKKVWERYGLFPHGGMDTILGKGKKDISMLMTYTVADGLLRDHGRLGFVITQSVLKSSGAGQGFRAFRIPGNGGAALRVTYVDDLSALNPFEGATNRTAVIILEKGRATQYPVPYAVWRKQRGARFTYDSTLGEVIGATRRLDFRAEPVEPDDATSPWLTARPRALTAMRRAMGRSDYVAHAGLNTGGANGVYWLEVVYTRPDGVLVVRNVTEGAKVKVDDVTDAVEPDLAYPLLRGRDVRRWWSKPSLHTLMVQDRVKRRGMDEAALRTTHPRTYGYLKRFERVLRARAAFRRYFTRKVGQETVETGPFYSMFNVGEYTFAPWKVVWREVADRLDAAVAAPGEGKPAMPGHTLILVACETGEEAHYLCAALNSAPSRLVVRAYIVLHPDPHILARVRIPRFSPEDAAHRRLAALSVEAHDAAARDDAVALRGIEADVDREAAKLWGLTEAELSEIQRSLAELEGEEPQANTDGAEDACDEE